MYTNNNKKMKIKDFSIITSGVNSKRSIDGDVYYLQARDFIDGYNLDDLMTPSISSSLKLVKHYLNKGDVLVLSKGHNGFKAYVYGGDKAPAVASSIFLVIRNVDKIVLSEYLCWYLNLKATQDFLVNLSRGSALPAINKSMVEDVSVPVVGLEVQRKIVDLDNLKRKETLLVSKLDGLKSQKLELKLKEIIR